MTPRRWCALLATSAMFCTSALVAADASAEDASAQTWVGIDGRSYQDAPDIVMGKPGSGYKFLGWDFDNACQVGAGIEDSIDELKRLAQVIRNSGRRVVFTVAPSKPSVIFKKLDLSTLPHGSCTLDGFEAQNAILDHYDDRDYLPLRAKLAAAKHQTYWRTDTHWTTVGGAVFAKALASRLSPALQRRQKYRFTRRSMHGLLNMWSGDPAVETAEAALPKRGVRVRTTKGVDPTEAITTDISWRSTPARRTWRGRSLLIGDSFIFVALENLRPLFHRGRFIWMVHHTSEEIAQAMLRADTIVLEEIHWSLSQENTYIPALTKAFRAALKAQNG